MIKPNWDFVCETFISYWQENYDFYSREMEPCIQLGEMVLALAGQERGKELRAHPNSNRLQIKKLLMDLEGNADAQDFFNELGMMRPFKGSPLAFMIRFERKRNGGFPVSFTSPEGEVRSIFQPPSSAAKSGALFNLALLRRHSKKREEFALIGSDLYKALFLPASGPFAGQLLESSLRAAQAMQRPLSLCFCLELEDKEMAEINRLPWELLYHEGFLARYHSVIRSIRSSGHRLRVQEQDSLNVLVAGFCAHDDLDLASEYGTVDNILTQSGHQVRFVQQYDWASLKRELIYENYQILHLMGHGEFTPASGIGHITMKDVQGEVGLLPATELANLLSDKGCGLVFANSCYSGRYSLAKGTDPFLGIATALIRRGIPRVVGIHEFISDLAAIRLTETFYRYMVAGYSAEVAFTEARRFLVGEEATHWDSFYPIFYQTHLD